MLLQNKILLVLNRNVPKLTEVRCTNCNKLLFVSKIKEGQVVIVCPRCKTENDLNIQPNKKPPDGQDIKR